MNLKSLAIATVMLSVLGCPAAEPPAGVAWPKVTVTHLRRVFQETAGDEAAFLFELDGSVLAVGRRGTTPAQVLRAKPPYIDWTRTDLEHYVGGPLVIKWGEFTVVGGRKLLPDRTAKTSLVWLVGDRLQEYAEFPSGGDNSYPGLVETGPGRALVSYYSSQERDAAGETIMAIYLAELAVEK